ncbi:MAG TPA: amino acid adenylation domain-containing protein, partial [Actinomycetota bacterium]|nr:amino acid adenylation domain-containing protein [Actinomycetota bacterium]
MTFTPVHLAMGGRSEDLAVVAGAASLTYAQLGARADCIAASLRAAGCGPDCVAGILLDRGPDLVASMLGSLGAGAAFLPLDPRLPLERLRFQVADSGARAVITDQSLEAPDGVAIVDPRGTDAPAPPAPVHPRCTAYVIYTSGSTGTPKGVMVEHASLADFCRMAVTEFALTRSDRVLQFASPSFDTAIEEVFPALVAGAAIVPRDADLWDPATLRRKVAELGVTVLDLPTAYWHEVVSSGEIPDDPRLRLVIAGGEAMSSTALRRWREIAPAHVRLVNTYGPTEATVTATAEFDPAPDPAAGSVSIGRPVAGVRAHVMDERRRPAPEGELCLAGAGVARGYLRRPGLTAERFVPDPSGPPGSRMYRTGDRVRTASGARLDFLGRTDHQVKIRGYRVELGEVEAAICSQPGVVRAAAAVHPGPGGTPVLVGYVQGTASCDDLRDALAQTLPGYMVPAWILALDPLPMTPTGKLDRRALPVPGFGAQEARAAGTADERMLSDVVAEVLGSRPDLDASFTDLGGDSLVATRVVSRVRERAGVEISVGDVLCAGSLRDLARVIAGAAPTTAAPMMRARRDRPLPLSFAQQRLWFVEELGTSGAEYAISASARLSGCLDADALRRSLEEIVRRHEALRTSFESIGGTPVQRVAEPGPVDLPVTDLGFDASRRLHD